MSDFTNISVVASDIAATVGAGTDETWELLKGPAWISKGELIAAWLSNGGALTGHATNYTTISVNNVTTTTTMASRAVDTATTDDVVADTPWSVTVSATAANKKFVAGDRIQWKKTDSGSGMALTAPVRLEAHFILNGTYD